MDHLVGRHHLISNGFIDQWSARFEGFGWRIGLGWEERDEGRRMFGIGGGFSGFSHFGKLIACWSSELKNGECSHRVYLSAESQSIGNEQGPIALLFVVLYR